MPRIAGVDIPENKHLSVSLTRIYGVGRKTALKILSLIQVNPQSTTKDLDSVQLQKLVAELEKVATEGELRKIIRDNIETLKRIKSYRGLRHSMGLPVRGQRTRSNARTRRGRRHTVGSMTKEARAKVDTAK